MLKDVVFYFDVLSHKKILCIDIRTDVVVYLCFRDEFCPEAVARCFPANFAKFARTPFFIEYL